MRLGEAFNVSVSGELSKPSEKEISREKRNDNLSCTYVKVMRTYDVSIKINNAEDKDNVVVVTHHVNDSKIVKESMKGKLTDVTTYAWAVPVAKNSKATLTYSVEISDRECR